MKRIKNLLALLLALIMVFGLAACNPSDEPNANDPETGNPDLITDDPDVSDDVETDPLKMITQNYYCYKFSAEGYGDFGFFFHFYEEDPVLGAVFYAGMSNNRQNFVGTYTVEELDYSYAIYPDRATEQEDAEPTEGVAPYTVTFFDWDGNEIGKCGFDGEILYNDMVEGSVIYSTGGAPFPYERDLDGAFTELVEGELGVPFLSFVADEDNTSTLSINHNKTYSDLVGAMVEGTWTVAENSDGGFDFTFIPDDSSDTGAIVSVSADRKTCVYTPDGGSPVAMSILGGAAPEIAHLFEGVTNVAAYGIDAALVLNLYDDGSCEIIADVQGNSMTLDTGTYTLDGHSFSFDFDAADDAQSSIDGSGTITVQFVLSGTKIGDVDTILTRNNG